MSFPAPRIAELAYPEQVADLFAHLVEWPWAVWLDSGAPSAVSGRYDILAADPSHRVTHDGQLTRVASRDGVSVSEQAPLAVVATLLHEPQATVAACPPEVPFCGGAIGYFGYDLMSAAPCRGPTSHMPLMAVGIYDWAVVVDHQTRRCWLTGGGRDPRTDEQWGRLRALFSRPGTTPPASPPLTLQGPLQRSLDEAAYGRAFDRIQTYIHEGDCYQVNFAQRFQAPVEGDPWATYVKQRAANPAPYGAYLSYPFGQILSSSPEQFLSLRGRHVTTRPIKGTRARAASDEDDRAVMQALRNSDKDRAENLMIVDLLRNDLGRVCRPGSIEVPALFEVESYATVHHLVSTVSGELATGEDALSLLSACFPGGSITGAPKIRAMQIIRELEPVDRQVYCGSIAWIGYDGRMDSNIAIRTLQVSDGLVRYWAGGGIVADSQMLAEYQESLDKAAAFFDLFELDVR